MENNFEIDISASCCSITFVDSSKSDNEDSISYHLHPTHFKKAIEEYNEKYFIPVASQIEKI